MGPQPPLKRRPTYTPYTLPCKRDISAKLTPAGVGASTHTAHQQKAKLSSSLRIDIYIYIYTHVDTVATNRYLTVTSLDIFRPLPTHFHPVFSVVCPPEFALVFPGYFLVSNFSTVSLSVLRHTSSNPRLHPFSILMPPRVFHFRSPPLLSHFTLCATV